MKTKIMVKVAIVLASSGMNVANAGDISFSLEEPAENATMSGISNIRGWAVSTVGISHIELSINGVYKTNIPYGGTRGDVGSNYPDYPGSNLSGFSMAHNYQLRTPGENVFTVVAVDNDGDNQTINRPFEVAKFQSSYFPQEEPFTASNSLAVTTGGTVILPNIYMDGEPYTVVMGWDKGKQGLSIEHAFAAGYLATSQDGTWTGWATPDPLATDFYAECGNATMNLTLADGQLSGSGQDAWENLYDIYGTVNSDGSTSGGFGIGGTEYINFEGSVTGNYMGGTWQDVSGCSGRWMASVTN